MATSSIFATVRVDSPKIAEKFVDSYDKHMESTGYLSRKNANHIIKNPESLKQLFKKKFPDSKWVSGRRYV